MKEEELEEEEEEEDREEQKTPPELTESEHDDDSDNEWFSSDNGGHLQEDDLDEYGEEDSENPMTVTNSSQFKKPPKGFRNRMVSWCDKTHYDVVKEVLKFGLDYHLTKKSRSDWDLAWWDGPPPI